MNQPSAGLLADMHAKDVGLTTSILERFNSGAFDDMLPVEVESLPAIDGSTVVPVDTRSLETILFRADSKSSKDALGSLGVPLPRGAEEHGGECLFSLPALRELGERLLPRTAFGVLNGGSATSYADSKKNLALGKDVFDSLADEFHVMAPSCRGRSKGLTAAYLNADGTPGSSFLMLKMRARLLVAQRLGYARGNRTTPRSGVGSAATTAPFMPLFQMTSVSNDEEIRTAYEAYRTAPELSLLEERTGIPAVEWLTAVQPMIAAYTHSGEGRPKRIFDRAYGRPDTVLALPGGHGQCFALLADIFRHLLDSGIRFACIGNVDNLGYVPDPVAVALLALSGRPAAFEFSLRTPIDVKGGILVSTGGGHRTVADIGPAVSFDRVLEMERRGIPALFNCATGLFDLAWLVPHLGEVTSRLPTRFTDQDKDAGLYSQAEQVTWEVTGILPDFLALAVAKHERFIAAKLLVETLLTSGKGRTQPDSPLHETSRLLHLGLGRALRYTYGMVETGGRWETTS